MRSSLSSRLNRSMQPLSHGEPGTILEAPFGEVHCALPALDAAE
jgi:hypothetical protein